MIDSSNTTTRTSTTVAKRNISPYRGGGGRRGSSKDDGRPSLILDSIDLSDIRLSTEETPFYESSGEYLTTAAAGGGGGGGSGDDNSTTRNSTIDKDSSMEKIPISNDDGPEYDPRSNFRRQQQQQQQQQESSSSSSSRHEGRRQQQKVVRFNVKERPVLEKTPSDRILIPTPPSRLSLELNDEDIFGGLDFKDFKDHHDNHHDANNDSNADNNDDDFWPLDIDTTSDRMQQRYAGFERGNLARS